MADLDREWSKASWDRVMDVNLKGPLDLTEKLLPVLAEGRYTFLGIIQPIFIDVSNDAAGQ